MEKYVFCLMVCACLAYTANGDTASSVPNQLWNSTWVDLLKKDLLTNYDKFARPTQHYNVTNIDIKLTITHIDIDEVKSVLTVHGWMKMSWTDDRLRWNGSDYEELEYIHMADHEVWQPDITLSNNAGGSLVDYYGSTFCTINNDGFITWQPRVRLEAFCNIDLTRWPYDTQTCDLIIESWAHAGDTINLMLDEFGGIEINQYIENHEWKIIDHSSKRNVNNIKETKEVYASVTYEVTMTRHSPLYRTIIVTPCVVVILMTLASFWFPPSSSEKIILNGVNAIIVCIFLVYFAQQLSLLTIQTPYIVLFYSSTLYLISFGIILSVIVIHLSHSKHSYAVPWFIKMFLESLAGTMLGLRLMDTEQRRRRCAEGLQETEFQEPANVEDQEIIDDNQDKTSLQKNWFLFAIAVDRIAFLLYSLFFITLAICYFI